MEVKNVVVMAKKYVAELFQGENITNLGLEEVVFDESKDIWHITLGFSRPWDEPRNLLASISNQPVVLKRTYKVVKIDDGTGRILSVTDRESRGLS